MMTNFMYCFGAMPEFVVERTLLMFLRFLPRRIRTITIHVSICYPERTSEGEDGLTRIVESQDHHNRNPHQINEDGGPRGVKRINTAKNGSDHIASILHSVMKSNFVKRWTPAEKYIEYDSSSFLSCCAVELGLVNVESICHALRETAE